MDTGASILVEILPRLLYRNEERMRILDILDRLEDRITEAIKSYSSGESLPTLEFDVELIEKDIELVKTLIKERKKNER